MQLIEEPIANKRGPLSEKEQEGVLQYVDGVFDGHKRRRTLGEQIAEIFADITDEEWEKLPTDGAEQHDHYIYGTPKR